MSPTRSRYSGGLRPPLAISGSYNSHKGAVMPLATDALRECHRLLKHLRELQKEIDLGPRVLKSRQDDLEAERQAHKDHHDSITKLKLKQREDEGGLKQTDT